jgi:hypothetical protein
MYWFGYLKTFDPTVCEALSGFYTLKWFALLVAMGKSCGNFIPSHVLNTF